jgi:hypothetical protein
VRRWLLSLAVFAVMALGNGGADAWGPGGPWRVWYRDCAGGVVSPADPIGQCEDYRWTALPRGYETAKQCDWRADWLTRRDDPLDVQFSCSVRPRTGRLLDSEFFSSVWTADHDKGPAR